MNQRRQEFGEMQAKLIREVLKYSQIQQTELDERLKILEVSEPLL